MGRLGRWIWREPWMALTAFVATMCATTIFAIRWLAILGVVRDFVVTRIPRSSAFEGDWTYGGSSSHLRLGLISGPSTALTQLDHAAWKIGLFAGILWMMRLGLRSADHRIGVLRGFGVLCGFGVFVVTGVAHRIVDAVIPRDRTRDRVDLVVSGWCVTVVLTAVFVMFTTSSGVGVIPVGVATPGDHFAVTPIGLSIARNALQLLVVTGGWAIAVFLTRSWIALGERADDADVSFDDEFMREHDALTEPG